MLSGCSGRVRRRAVVPLGYGRVLPTHTTGLGPRERSWELTGDIAGPLQTLFISDMNRTGKGLRMFARVLVNVSSLAPSPFKSVSQSVSQ